MRSFMAVQKIIKPIGHPAGAAATEGSLHTPDGRSFNAFRMTIGSPSVMSSDTCEAICKIGVFGQRQPES
jgi:hypothetical protein